MFKCIDLTVEALEEHFKTSFFARVCVCVCVGGGGGGTHYNTAEGEADQNQMVLDVREGAVKIFHFAEFINE